MRIDVKIVFHGQTISLIHGMTLILLLSLISHFYLKVEIEIKHEVVSVFNKKINLCSKAAKPRPVTGSFAILGIPTNCPMKKNTIFCYNQDKPIIKATENSLKILELFFRVKQLNVNMKLNVTHGTGFSCFELDFKISSR